MSLNNITIPRTQKEIKSPLIEKFLVIGIAPSDVRSKKSLIFHDNQINLDGVQKLPVKILEEYKSNSICYNTNSYSQENHNNYLNNNSFLNNLLPFIFPKGIQAKLGHNNPYHSYLSFTVNLFSKRKHISILNFYENYTISGINFSLSKIICLISAYEIYNTMNSILEHLYQNIISPENQTENSKNKKNYRYLYIKNQAQGKATNYLILQEKQITEFFCSFILNSLTYTNTLKNSIMINYPNNNIGKNTYLTYNIESKEDIPLKDYDISILFNRFNVDDIIILYGGLLMGYKIILLFDNYSEINLIIFSLLSLIYPLKWKKYPIISYISEKNSKLIDMVESPVSVIIGLDINYKDLLQEKIKNGDCERDTYVYNLISKSFVPVSKENNNVNLPSIIGDEIKIELHRFMAEKISLDKNIDAQNSELAQMFEGIHGIDKKVYYNYKIISIFYFGFLQMIKELPNCLKNKRNLSNNNQNKFFLPDYFDFQKFKYDKRFLCENDTQFMHNFSTSMIFNEFLHKYIMNIQKKEKFKKISNHLSMLSKSSNNEDGIIKLRSVLHKQIKEFIIQYYDFTYISMDRGLENYYSKLQDLCISNRQSSKDKNNYTLWYPLEIYKVKTSPGSMDDFITSKPKDEEINKLILSIRNRGNTLRKKEFETYKEFAEDKEKLSTPIKYSYSNISFEDASTFISTIKSMAKYNKDFYFHQSTKKEKNSEKKLDKVGTKVSILAGDIDECNLFSE